MTYNNYVRRWSEKKHFERLHAASNTHLLCGPVLDERWFVESSCGRTIDDITCVKCRKVLNG